MSVIIRIVLSLKETEGIQYGKLVTNVMEGGKS